MDTKGITEGVKEVSCDFRKVNMGSDSKKLIIKFKDVYGRELAYPENEVANLFCKLMDAKAFTRKQLEMIHQLGFEIEVVREELDFSGKKKGK